MALISFATAVVELYIFFTARGVRFDQAPANHLYIPAVFALGPGTYVGFRAALDARYRWRSGLLLLVPTAIVSLGLMLVAAAAPAHLERTVRDYFTTGGLRLPEFLLLGGCLQNLACYGGLILRERRMFTPGTLRTEVGARLLLIVIVCCAFLTAYCGLAFALQSVRMLYSGGLALAVFAVATYLSGQRSPLLLNRAQEAVREAYRNSRLQSLNLEELEENLTRLMQSERLYRRRDLTLATLSRLLEVSPHQLSEFLNAHQGVNFSRFVNGWRVREAVAILEAEVGVAVPAVAARVGFGSRANFNLAFRQELSLSPSEFLRRRRHRA